MQYHIGRLNSQMSFQSSDLPKTKKDYTSSRTRAEAPPPPLQTPAAPYFPFFCLNTCKYCIGKIDMKQTSKDNRFSIFMNTRQDHIRTLEVTIVEFKTPNVARTPRSVTNIRAPLHPRGCPKDTAPPCTLTFS